MQHVNSINAVKFSNCIRFSNDENILKLFSSLDPASRKHIVLSYFSSFKQSVRDRNLSQDGNIFARFGQILEHQIITRNATKTTEDESSELRTKRRSKYNLSSDLWANIISFVNMKDRLLIMERISTKLYDICQRPEAESELVITKSFVRHALYDEIDLSKFHHIKRLCIDFVFRNPTYNYYKRDKHEYTGDLESKYYKIIHHIMSSSVSTLHTIEYNLSENAFRSFLGDSNQWNQQYEGCFLDFVSNLCITNPDINPFAHVDTLIWIEKETKNLRWMPGGGKSVDRTHQWLRNAQDVQQFIHYFKSIKSLMIPDHFNVSSYPLVSQIWSNQQYYQRIQHLSINLKEIMLDDDEPQDEEEEDDNVVTEIGHPLVMLYKFKRLQSLRLVLPIFKACAGYYDALLSTISRDDIITNELLVDIAIEFEIDSYVTSPETLCVMDTIWDYTVAHCPNILRFKCVVNNHSNVGLKHTNRGYISKLNERIECIYYASDGVDIRCNMLPCLHQLNVYNVKELTLEINAHKCTDVCDDKNVECLKLLRLERFKSLQSFKYMYGKACTFRKGEFIDHVMANVIGFLRYIHSQTGLSSTLNYIQLLHAGYRGKKGYRSFFRHYVEHLSICAEESVQIAKLLTGITTKHEQIKIMELLPIGIREEELRFLGFWYNGLKAKHGELNVKQWHKIKKSYFVDLKLRSDTDS